MTISADDVRHVARLARLHITDDDATRITGELDRILDHVGRIAELDLEGVEPTTHVLDLHGVHAADEPHECLDHDEAIANAPRVTDGQFSVPRMQS